MALLATQGLLAFRQGNAVLGEQLHLESVEQARAEKDRADELLAQLYLARERHRAGRVPSGFDELLAEAEAAAEPGVILAARKIGHEVQTGLDSPVATGEALEWSP